VLETALSLALLAAHVAAILTVLLDERRQSNATLAWVFALIFLPALGLIAFVLIGRTQARRMARRAALVAGHLQPLVTKHAVLSRLDVSDASRTDWRTRSMLRLGVALASSPASDGNRASLLVDAAATYAAMKDAIASARKHVHVEFYVFRGDETGRELRDLLVEAARRGVEVRAVCDGLGSIELPRNFWRPLVDAGGKAATYRPVWRRLEWLVSWKRIDFRNHRKLVVVDGRIGFTGGINVGREYLGLDPAHGRWRDTHLKLEGPAVLSMQLAFGEDWLVAAGEPLDSPSYFPEPDDVADPGAIVQIIDSGPDREFSAISYFHVQACAHARHRIWITNPYFVPNSAVRDALIAAALRGVDVRLLLPERSDSPIVRLAAVAHYPRLFQAGVRVFHYAPGVLHAKTMVVDGWVATVGSANMDMRSFYLNFELNAFVFGGGLAHDLARRFQLDLRESVEVTAATLRRASLPLRLARSGARLLSPLL
jgi:cardiolipin synthase A/B